MNATTSVAIVRTPRDHYRMVWVAITTITSLQLDSLLSNGGCNYTVSESQSTVELFSLKFNSGLRHISSLSA